MTLLNTVANLGSLLTKQIVTYGVDYTTAKACTATGDIADAPVLEALACPVRKQRCWFSLQLPAKKSGIINTI